MPERTNVVLVGFMGAGKTEVGRRLAERLGRVHLETDDLVAAGGKRVAEIFAHEGERHFRALERQAVVRCARVGGAVVSTGGGVVVDPRNVRDLRRSGPVVYLEVSADELVRRLRGSQERRPLLVSPDGLEARVRSLLAARDRLYVGAAHYVVRCDGKSVDDVVEEIVSLLREPVRVRVRTHEPYTVFIGRGLLERALELLPLDPQPERVLIVTHRWLRRRYGARLDTGLAGVRRAWATIDEGEGNKTLETAGRLVRVMARSGLHRNDLVVALGGGVVGDVAGFAASIYARGLRVVQLPTTLLAMVDASVGGKTGVNLPEGKNLVGTFHQPAAVIADLDVLETLPERELRGGLAEVVKYAFIADPPLRSLLLRRRDEVFSRGPILGEVVRRCVAIKARIVADDEFDRGERAILNYGHTLGHAVEGLSGRGLHHGEAVAVGMVYAAAVAAIEGLSDLRHEHREVLEALGLPVGVHGVRWPEVRRRIFVDKKYRGGHRLVLLQGLGRPVVQHVSEDVLRRAFAEVRAA